MSKAPSLQKLDTTPSGREGWVNTLTGLKYKLTSANERLEKLRAQTVALQEENAQMQAQVATQ
jgi:hypothetical protein